MWRNICNPTIMCYFYLFLLANNFFLFTVASVVVSKLPDSTTINDEIHPLVHAGRLSAARYTAFQFLHRHSNSDNHELRRLLSTSFIEAFDQAVSDDPNKYLHNLHSTLQSNCDARKLLMFRRDLPDCIPAVPVGSDDPTRAWDDCCSMLPQNKGLDILGGTIVSNCAIFNPCCEFFVGSSAYLRLPALHEPALAIRLDFFSSDDLKMERKNVTTNTTAWTTILDLEQDGYLRLFDVAGILWPSGYLLTQCMSNPKRCGIQDLLDMAWSRHHSGGDGDRPMLIELGTGVGAASIASALYLQQGQHYSLGRDKIGNAPSVVATDVSPHSLALTLSNSWCNGANVTVDFLNYDNMTSVLETRQHYYPAIKSSEPTGFPVVIGSSLQSIFEDSHNNNSNLWTTLDLLLDKHNPHALAVFVHTRSNPLTPPPNGSFELVRQISGDILEMQTRTGETSDFELFLFRRGIQNY